MGDTQGLAGKPATMASLSRALERRMGARQLGKIDAEAAVPLAFAGLLLAGAAALGVHYLTKPSIELKKDEWACVEKGVTLQQMGKNFIPVDYCLTYKRLGERGVTEKDAVMEMDADALVSEEDSASAALRERQR